MLAPIGGCGRSCYSWTRRSTTLAGKYRLVATCAVTKRARSTGQASFGYSTGFALKYDVGELLGAGSFGAVHVAVDKVTGERFAVKSIPKRFLGGRLDEKLLHRVQHEVDVLRHLGGSLNMAQLQGVYEDERRVDMVMELCEGGQLWSRIRPGAYSERQAARILRDVLRSVAQCHARGIIVRDVKPENFLFVDLRPGAPLKMVDFGFAEYLAPGQVLSERAGTVTYIAPEVLRQRYGFPADLWSVGILAYQLLAGRFPWRADDLECESESTCDVAAPQRAGNRVLWRAIMYAPLDFMEPPWDTISPQARDLVQSLLQRDPEQRLTADQALSHPWLAKEGAGAAGGVLDAPLSDTLVQRLQRFGTYGKLKQTALKAVTNLMSADDAALRALRLLDDGAQLERRSGKVAYADVAALLGDGRFQLSAPELRQLLAQFEVDAEGNVNYDAWIASLVDWGQVEASDQWQHWVERVFNKFDLDGSGRLSVGELHEMLCEEGCIADTVPAALREADKDGDGTIGFEDFIALLHTSSADRLDLYQSRRRGGTPSGLAIPV